MTFESHGFTQFSTIVPSVFLLGPSGPPFSPEVVNSSRPLPLKATPVSPDYDKGVFYLGLKYRKRVSSLGVKMELC